MADEAAQALRGLSDHLAPRPAKPDCVPGIRRTIGVAPYRMQESSDSGVSLF